MVSISPAGAAAIGLGHGQTQMDTRIGRTMIRPRMRTTLWLSHPATAKAAHIIASPARTLGRRPYGAQATAAALANSFVEVGLAASPGTNHFDLSVADLASHWRRCCFTRREGWLLGLLAGVIRLFGFCGAFGLRVCGLGDRGKLLLFRRSPDGPGPVSRIGLRRGHRGGSGRPGEGRRGSRGS